MIARIHDGVYIDRASARELVQILEVMVRVPDFTETAKTARLRKELRSATGTYASVNARMPVGQWITDPTVVHCEDDLLDSAQTARLLGITANAVRDLRRRGRLTGERVGGRWAFRRRDVAALLASRSR